MAKSKAKSKTKAAKSKKPVRPRMKGDRPPPHIPAGTNMTTEVRLKSLNEALERWCDLQDEEDSLIERYIKPIRDKKNGVKADVKRDFDIPVKAFNARANLRLIERMDDADEVVLAVNEMFQATPVGSNIDLVELAERVAAKRAEKEAEAAAKEKAKSEGQTTETDL